MIEALLEAGPTRLRPILMTSAAVVYTFMDRFTLQGRRARAAERKAAKGAPKVAEEPVREVARDGAAEGLAR